MTAELPTRTMGAPSESLDYDVVVIGGGPGGSLSASLLRRQCPGLRVLIIERVAFPRHHVGEACLPGWAPVLERAGVLAAAGEAVEVDKLGFVFHWGPDEARGSWTADFRDECGVVPAGSWHVDRAKFDQVLLQHARALGADVWQPCRVTQVVPRRGPTPPSTVGATPGFDVGVLRDGEPRTVTTARIIDASGQARFLANHWSLPTRRHSDMNNYALYGYWRGGGIETGGAPLRGRERWAVVSSGEFGWVWHIPISDDISSVGLVTNRETLKRTGAADLKKLYLDAVRDAQQIGDMLSTATYVGDRPDGGEERVNAVQDWSYVVDRLCGAGWYIVGDGAIFVDPILSSGLNLAATGASMVANAITTLERDVGADPELLRDSLATAYRDISAAYHRMARVWYRQNTGERSWHWQAKQERLRTHGAKALFEDDADAFTAVCLGAINSPLNAALAEHSQEIWGSEYFSWITTDRLFGRAGGDDQGRSKVRGVQDARAAVRRSLLRRWQRLVDARLVLRSAWSASAGYHTNRFAETWQPIRYVSVALDDALDPDLRIACPSFEDRPHGIFPALDGQATVRGALEDLVRPYPRGSQARDARMKALSESLLQLDMLGLLEVEEPAQPPPTLAHHPLLTVLTDSVLRALARPAKVYVEVDWLGDSIWFRVLAEGTHQYLRLIDARDATRERGVLRSATTGVQWPRGQQVWLDRTVARLLLRLRKLESGPRRAEVADVWSTIRPLSGAGLVVQYSPGESPVVEAG